MTETLPTLLAAAADWLLLGGVERLIHYVTVEDAADPQAALDGRRELEVLLSCRFRVLCTNGRGYRVPLEEGATPPPDRRR